MEERELSDKNILVVAFDGLDYELIQRYGLENIPQTEFGRINNNKNIKYRYTSELFASFITGVTWEEHGVVKLCRSDRGAFKRKIRQGRLLPKRLVGGVRGFNRLESLIQKILTRLVSFDEDKYTKEDLEVESIFEKIDTAKPLFVPSYNPDPRWQLKVPHAVAQYEDRERVRDYTERLTKSRLDDFKELSFNFWDFIMLHMHDPDPQQDLDLGHYQQDYQRLDEIAGEIIDLVPDNWTIIFMSDHGRLEGEEHNENAFYSCNEELFSDKTPHITDFHDKILELEG